MINNKTTKLFRGIAILIVIASHYAEWMFTEPVYPTAKEWISTWGPVGVSIFFLFSGYGLVKSAISGEAEGKNNGGITFKFIIKRFLFAYLPYVLIVGTIHFIFKDFAQADVKFYKDFLTGYDYWYMNVLFMMYIMFTIAWRFGANNIIRLILITIAVIAMTVDLFNKGRADFWQLSNMAFLIGIYGAAGEKYFLQTMKKLWFKILICAIGIIGFGVCFQGMTRAALADATKVFGWELSLNIFFAIMILGLSYFISVEREKVFTTLGDNSLFIYLLHTVLFWQLIFKFENSSYMKATIFTALLTLAISVTIGTLYNILIKFVLKKLV